MSDAQAHDGVDVLTRDLVELGLVREFSLSNPARRNALNEVVLKRLSEELARAASDGIRCVLIRGEGSSAFSAGYDLNELPSASGSLPDHQLAQVLDQLEASPFATVAWLNGHAFGGGLELAARCDLRIASVGIKLGMPPAKLGIVYAPRGLARFFALCGAGGARRLFLTGEPVTAEDALALGLIDEVLESSRAEARAQSVAQSIATNAPLAIEGTRRILAQLERSLLSGVDAVAAEQIRRRAFTSEDAAEGRAAFLEKRTPSFKGR